jgi:Uma2 family endonuclease
MTAATPLPPPIVKLAKAPDEQRMLVRGVRWKDYVILREALDTPGLRMTYYKGALEFMSPSRNHELWKKNIARLIEFYALERGIDLYGYGGTTFRREAEERGLEPDECYAVDRVMPEGDVPDIALEVIYTSPLLDKLEVYRGLGVREVWLFEKGTFSVFGLEGGRYVRLERSTLVPTLDLAVIARFATREDQPQALRELRDLLRSGT